MKQHETCLIPHVRPGEVPGFYWLSSLLDQATTQHDKYSTTLSYKCTTGRRNLRWKDECKKDMIEAGLKEDNATSRTEWREKLTSYTGDPRWRDKPGTNIMKNILQMHRYTPLVTLCTLSQCLVCLQKGKHLCRLHAQMKKARLCLTCLCTWFHLLIISGTTWSRRP